MYDNTNFPRPDYLKKMESRVDTLVRHAQTSRETAPESSLNSARKAAEAICGCTLMKHKLPKSGKIPFNLEPMLNLLKENEYAMPHYIRLHAETLQKWGNAGSHFNFTEEVPPEEIAAAMQALQSLVDWFYKDNNLTRKPAPEVKPAKPEIKPAESAAKTEPAKKPAEDSVEVPRCKANNAFEVWVEMSGNRGALTFYSMLSRSVDDPAYVDLERKEFFDLGALVDSIKSIYCHLMGRDEAYTLIHYEKPGRWQACSPMSAIREDVSKFQIPFTVETAELADNMDLNDFFCSPEGPYFDAFELELNSRFLTLTFLKDGQRVQPAGGRIALELSCNSQRTSPDDTIVFSSLHDAAEHLIVHAHPGRWIETELAFTPNDQTVPRFLRDHLGYTEIRDDSVSSYSLRYEMIPMTEEEVLHPRETMNDLYRERSRLSTDLNNAQLDSCRTQIELNLSERKLKRKSRLIVAACIASLLTMTSLCWFPGDFLMELLVGVYHFVLVLVMVIHWWRS